MSTTERLERDLTAWFVDSADRVTPDFAEDILIETRSLRQRPRWTFVPLFPRPMDRSLLRPLPRPSSTRQVAILALIAGLLALAATATWVGSQRRLPPPFGRAANGLVAYEKGGDIFVVDPATGERRGLVLGPETDRFPRWSLDGTQVAFVRVEGSGSRLVVVDASGSVRSVSTGEPLRDVDPDGIAWAPNGRTVLVKAVSDRGAGFHLIDVPTGRASIVPVTPWALEAYWRPPDGRELLFVGGSDRGPALYRYALADGTISEVPGTTVVLPTEADPPIRPIGWTPDGTRFAYHRPAADAPGDLESAVVDVETGASVVLDLAYGRISNDGTRIVGIASDGDREWLCVAPVDGGPCARIDGDPKLVDLTGWASFQWAPDDTWIRADPGDGLPAILLSPTGGQARRPSWAAEGAESWQRRAP